MEKTDEEVYTYTYAFFEDDNEWPEARQIAEHYGTKHTEILIKPFVARLPEIMYYMDRPRFNLQSYWLAEKAKEDGRETAYVGEGLDEHFGGYWYKTEKNYIESWIDHFQFIRPTYMAIHKIFGIRCELPFTYLPMNDTLNYWDPEREKTYLRWAYKDIIPKFAVERRKRPGRPTWKTLWERELFKIYPHLEPKTDEEIRTILNRYATAIWLGVQK